MSRCGRRGVRAVSQRPVGRAGALIEPMITAWKQERVARSATRNPGVRELREVVKAIFYQNRTGRQWRYLPAARPASMTNLATTRKAIAELVPTGIEPDPLNWWRRVKPCSTTYRNL